MMSAGMFDVVVIGAGLGGLMAAAKLARSGLRVLVLERKITPGGTSYIFRRMGYAFPMGPLSFGFPGRVLSFLAEAGVSRDIGFRRSGFEVRTPSLDVIISRPLSELEAELARLFPGEAAGLRGFFAELGSAIAVSKDRDLWHPDFQGAAPGAMPGGPEARFLEGRVRAVNGLAGISAAAVLDRHIADPYLRNLLGSMGSEPPEMSMLNLALMWNVMAEEGIWFPEVGVHGLADLLRERLAASGGELRLGRPVAKVLVEDGRACGVVTADGETIRSRWVVSNADYKTTFLDLLDPRDVPATHLDEVRAVPYTGSELCVYLGLRPDEVDLSALRVEHLFYRPELGEPSGPADFARREIEICLWSRKAPALVPEGRAAIVLRASFPYEELAPMRTGEKRRAEGYAARKKALADALVATAERVLPGLAAAVEVREAATPLTYRDWGGRRDGSIAGWAWAARPAGAASGKVLVRTPVAGLLAVGAYAATELFLGGVPTALFTGRLAAEIVLSEGSSR